jgi:hypothetical protein
MERMQEFHSGCNTTPLAPDSCAPVDVMDSRRDQGPRTRGGLTSARTGPRTQGGSTSAHTGVKRRRSEDRDEDIDLNTVTLQD